MRSEHLHVGFSMQTLIKEMKKFSKEELQGLIKCIEQDSSVTYAERVRGGYEDVIHGDANIIAYMMASYLLAMKG